MLAHIVRRKVPSSAYNVSLGTIARRVRQSIPVFPVRLVSTPLCQAYTVKSSVTLVPRVIIAQLGPVPRKVVQRVRIWPLKVVQLK
jgi:hypothetical protein